MILHTAKEVHILSRRNFYNNNHRKSDQNDNRQNDCNDQCNRECGCPDHHPLAGGTRHVSAHLVITQIGKILWREPGFMLEHVSFLRRAQEVKQTTDLHSSVQMLQISPITMKRDSKSVHTRNAISFSVIKAIPSTSSLCDFIPSSGFYRTVIPLASKSFLRHMEGAEE